MLEISAILLLCAALLLALAQLDRRGRERMTSRAAQVASADRQTPRPLSASAPVAVAQGRVADRGAPSVLLLLMGGTGLAMAGAGLRMISRRSA